MFSAITIITAKNAFVTLFLAIMQSEEVTYVCSSRTDKAFRD